MISPPTHFITVPGVGILIFQVWWLKITKVTRLLQEEQRNKNPRITTCSIRFWGLGKQFQYCVYFRQGCLNKIYKIFWMVIQFAG